MPTSAEIAQQIQDQQSWFMQQNAMASQIGMSPMAYGQGGGQPVMPGHPGMGPMPSSFSFAPRNYPGLGNRAAGIAGGVMGATPMLASVLGGSSPLTNPISGFLAARGMGMGIGAAAGAAGLMAAPMMAAGAVIGQGVAGMQQQSMLNTATMGGGYSFANSQSLTGQGFNRQDAMAIGRQVRQLQMIPELMTSFEEITKILPQLKNIGVMQGVRDAAEFSKRMRESITTIREVSKILGTTMEDATEFFAHSRRVGFFGRQDQVRNAMNAQVTMSITGMDRQTQMKMQEQAAAAGTAIGGSRSLAVKGTENIAQRIGIQVRDNPALQSTIQNITGQDGPEGIAALSGMLLNAGQRISGTAAGRFMMAGFMKVGEDGEVNIDEKLMERHRRGEISMDEVRRMGMRNMGNRSFVKKFEGRQTKLGQQFAGAGGMENLSQMLYGAFGEDEDSARVVMQNQFGLSEEMTDFTLQGMRDERTGVAGERRAMSRTVERNARRRQNSVEGLGKRMGKSFSNMFEPLKQAGAEIGNMVGSTMDEITQDLMGDFVVTATEDAKKSLIEGLVSRDGKEAMKKAFGDGLASAKTVGRGDWASGPFSAVSGATSRLIGLGGGADKSLTSMTSELLGYSGSSSMSTLVAETWKGSDLGSWVNSIGTNTTGRSAQGQLNKYGEMFGLGGTGATQEGLQARIKQMSDEKFWTGSTEKGGGPSAEMQTAAKASAEIIRDLAANNEEYQQATEQKKFEMARDAINSAYSRDIIAGKSALQGRGTDAATALFMGAQQHLKGSAAAADLGNLGDLGAEGLDPTRVAQAQRDAAYDMGRQYGQDNAAVLMKSESAREVMGSLTAMTDGPNKNELKAALAAGKSDIVKKLTGKDLSQEEMRAISQGFKNQDSMLFNTKSNADVLGAFDKAKKAGNALALKTATDEVKAEVDKQFSDDKSPIGDLMRGFGKAAADLGGNQSGGNIDAFKKAVDAASEAIEKLPPEEREKVMAKLPPSMQAALAKRGGAKRGLSKLGGAASVSEISKAIGMSEENVLKTLGKSGDGKTNLRLDSDTVAKLEKAAGQAAAGSNIIGGAEAVTKKAKEDQQLVLMKTMTEALIAIAGDKMDGKVLQEYNTNKTNASGAATTAPGKKP